MFLTRISYIFLDVGQSIMSQYMLGKNSIQGTMQSQNTTL